MDYQTMSNLEELMKYQIKFINYMDGLIQFDEEYTSKTQNEELPPIVNIGVLKSHFLTQKKACEGVLSITARHLSRLKEEYDKNKKVTEVKQVKPVGRTQQITSPLVEKKPDLKESFISLF